MRERKGWKVEGGGWRVEVKGGLRAEGGGVSVRGSEERRGERERERSSYTA